MLNIKDFTLLAIIGSGSCSQVFKAKHKEKIYSLKAQEKDHATLDTTGVREKNLWKGMNHPFVMTMLATFKTSHHLCYVMEYMQGGDLSHIIQLNNGTIPEKNAKFYTAELSVAVDYLHSNGIVHRDIKPKNILVAADGHIKLTDFDLSIDLRHEGETNVYCGTPGFMAPEICENKKYSYEVDWWSVGATLHFMLYGRVPVRQKDKKTEAHTSKTTEDPISKKLDKFEKYPHSISQFAKSILRGFMTENPKNRLGKEGLAQVQSHSFFMGIEWKEIEDKNIKPPFVPNEQNISNTHERLLSERFSLSANYRMFKQYELVSNRVARERHFHDFDYINPDWEN